MTGEIEFSEDMFLVTRETADAYLKSKQSPPPASAEKPASPDEGAQPKSPVPPVEKEPTTGAPGEKAEQLTFSKLGWSGEVPPQKWMNFYTKVLAKYASTKGLKVKISVEVGPDEGVSKTKAEETRAALRELGLNDELNLL
jgi:hypothetical protein